MAWEFCKANEESILFILDGYDELNLVTEDRKEVENLIKSKDFPQSKVIITSRPNILQVIYHLKALQVNTRRDLCSYYLYYV